MHIYADINGKDTRMCSLESINFDRAWKRSVAQFGHLLLEIERHRYIPHPYQEGRGQPCLIVLFKDGHVLKGGHSITGKGRQPQASRKMAPRTHCGQIEKIISKKVTPNADGRTHPGETLIQTTNQLCTIPHPSAVLLQFLER